MCILQVTSVVFGVLSIIKFFKVLLFPIKYCGTGGRGVGSRFGVVVPVSEY